MEDSSTAQGLFVAYGIKYIGIIPLGLFSKLQDDVSGPGTLQNEQFHDSLSIQLQDPCVLCQTITDWDRAVP